ncbi:AIM24 family protein [Nocardia sp. NBC_01377]|uniref:AIM24 family protein n=1 Tax=Nocardia sp. NBC_01377 TaxID=2903595 RepID=UPI00324A8F93
MFEKVNGKVVKVNVGMAGGVVARNGAMLFYTGDISFSPHQIPGAQGMGGGGIMGMAGRMMAGEHERTMLAQGNGEVHYGLAGLEVHVVQMQPGATLRVEASRLLANSAQLQSSIVSVMSSGGGGGGGGGIMGALRGAAAGTLTGQGMFTTQLAGQGSAVLLAHGGFLELQVGGPHPIVVDPQAFVAAYGNVQTELKSALSWRDAVGKGSGEAMQLHCVGQGVVYVQASEEKL